jgi:hypothetical protein
MERIDRNNYEIFFIDYIDGNLPLGEIDLLLDFLNENPDLAEELKGLEKIILRPVFHLQNSFAHLKKTDLDLPEIFEETCIRAIENDLSDKELHDFDDYLQQREDQKRIFELYRLTVSEPDPFIVYEKKYRLKKKEKGFVFKYWYAVAAIIILGLMLFIPTDQNPIVKPNLQVAKMTETKVSTPLEVKRDIDPIPTVKLVKNHSVIAKNETVQEPITEKKRKVDFIEPLISFTAVVKNNSDLNQYIDLISVAKLATKSGKDYSKYLTVNEYLSQKVDEIREKEKNGFFGKLALNTLKKVTGKKFDYTTNKGKINTFEFNSKLLAFSIPVNSTEN